MEIHRPTKSDDTDVNRDGYSACSEHMQHLWPFPGVAADIYTGLCVKSTPDSLREPHSVALPSANNTAKLQNISSSISRTGHTKCRASVKVLQCARQTRAMSKLGWLRTGRHACEALNIGTRGWVELQ
jgi:hypothetical protein